MGKINFREGVPQTGEGSPFRSRQFIWSSDELLQGISAADLSRTPLDLNAFEPVLWNDLASEYDARFMFEHIRFLLPDRTPQLSSILTLWYQDEANHFVGFRRLYSLFFNQSAAEIDARLARRRPDFSMFEPYFASECELCVLFAFDEIATARSYLADGPFYDQFGIPELGRWIRAVARDEAAHFRNFTTFVRGRFKDRSQEFDAIVDGILELDLAKPTYEATFVLDHTGPGFSRSFLLECARLLKDALTR